MLRTRGKVRTASNLQTPQTSQVRGLRQVCDTHCNYKVLMVRQISLFRGPHITFSKEVQTLMHQKSGFRVQMLTLME